MSLSATLAHSFRAAVRGIDLVGLTSDVLAVDAPRETRDVRILAVGKAAPAMASGALAAYRSAVVEALVIAPDDTASSIVDARVTLLRAAHPLPDMRSVDAGNRAMELVLRAREGQAVVVLVSGGASSLVCAPQEGVALETKAAVISALLRSGASISELNVVRRHLSLIKGGGLARVAFSRHARLLTLLAVDVIGGDVHDVGSGPTTPDPTTIADARAVLWRRAPSFASLPMTETWKPTAAEPQGQVAIVVDPDGLASAVSRELGARGFAVRVLPASNAPASELVVNYTQMAASLAPGEAIVRAAEPSLVVDPSQPGRGGRAGHLAALVARHLPPDVAFLSGASDGVDGSSGTAGAVVRASSIQDAGAARWADALARFDTGTLHLELGTAIPGGATGLNLCDAHVLARSPR